AAVAVPGGAAAGLDPRGRAGVRARRSVWMSCIRAFGEHHVTVRSADAERADARDQRLVRGRPGAQLGLHAEVQGVQVDGWVGAGEVETGRQLSMAYGQGRLEQAHDSGRGLQVADVRFRGAERDAPPAVAAGAVDRSTAG